MLMPFMTSVTSCILIADQGYESYNNIAHLEKKGWKYIIQVKPKNIGRRLLSKTDLPVGEEFDKKISVLMANLDENFTLKDLKYLYHKRWVSKYLLKSSSILLD